MSSQIQEQLIPQTERRPSAWARNVGRIALVTSLGLTTFGMLAGETEPGAPASVDRPAAVSVFMSAADSHPDDNSQQRSIEGMLEHATEVHDEPSGNPDVAESISDAFTQDTSYGAHDKPGDNPDAPVASHTAYGPVDVNQLQSVGPLRA